MKERGDMSIRLKIADFLIRTTMKPVLKRLNSPRLIRWWFENIVGDPLLAPRGLWQKPFVFEHAAGKLNGLCVGTKSHQSDAPAILYFLVVDLFLVPLKAIANLRLDWLAVLVLLPIYRLIALPPKTHFLRATRMLLPLTKPFWPRTFRPNRSFWLAIQRAGTLPWC